MRPSLRIAWLALATACAPTAPRTGQARSPIVAGAVDAHDAAVVVWEAHVPGDKLEELCTAEVSAPREVRPTAHCTKDRGTPGDYHVSSDVMPAGSNHRIALDEVHRPDESASDLQSITGNGYD